jgi:hypothetical protein
MGYTFHITRKEYWSDDDGPRITLAEWLDYLSTDPDIVADPINRDPENYLLVSRPERWPLWWKKYGEIQTVNPDDGVIRKLVEIAEALEARVLGDDDEIYGMDPTDPTVPFLR